VDIDREFIGAGPILFEEELEGSVAMSSGGEFDDILPAVFARASDSRRDQAPHLLDRIGDLLGVIGVDLDSVLVGIGSDSFGVKKLYILGGHLDTSIGSGY
jgi:hypothetical protein